MALSWKLLQFRKRKSFNHCADAVEQSSRKGLTGSGEQVGQLVRPRGWRAGMP